MPDALRLGCFGLAVAALLVSSALLAGRLRLGPVGTVLAIWLMGSGQIVLLAELLSLLHQLDWPGFLVGHLLIMGAVALIERRRPSGALAYVRASLRSGLRGVLSEVRDRKRPALLILTSATLLVGLYGAVLAVWVPPNTLDSLTYHLSRIGYYLQFRGFDPFPTPDPRLIVFPANAEILILWTAAFLRSDRLAGMVQLAGWAASAVAVYGLAREIGLDRRAALFCAGYFALLPGAVLESTSTQNDLLVASFGLSSLLFILWAARCRPTLHLALAGAAAGLMLGTKGTGVLIVPGLALIGVLVVKGGQVRRLPAGVLLGAALAVPLGAYFYLQNWLFYGSFFGPAGYTAGFPGASPGLFAANLVRYIYAFFVADLSGPLADPRARPFVAPITAALGAGAERFFAALGIPTTLAALDSGQAFQFVRRPSVTEDVAGGGPIGSLMMVAALAALVWPGCLSLRRRLLAVAILSFLLLQIATVDVNAGVARYLLIAFAMAAPLLGVV